MLLTSGLLAKRENEKDPQWIKLLTSDLLADIDLHLNDITRRSSTSWKDINFVFLLLEEVMGY